MIQGISPHSSRQFSLTPNAFNLPIPISLTVRVILQTLERTKSLYQKIKR